MAPHAPLCLPCSPVAVSFPPCVHSLMLARCCSVPAATRRECLGLWTNTFGDLLQEEKIEWRGKGEGSGRPPERPICWLPFLGCIYL